MLAPHLKMQQNDSLIVFIIELRANASIKTGFQIRDKPIRDNLTSWWIKMVKKRDKYPIRNRREKKFKLLVCICVTKEAWKISKHQGWWCQVILS